MGLNGFSGEAVVEEVSDEAYGLEGPGEDYGKKSWGEIADKFPSVVKGK